jgi:hypothetical protein
MQEINETPPRLFYNFTMCGSLAISTRSYTEVRSRALTLSRAGIGKQL